MNLGINAMGLFPGKIGGAEQYLRNIVKKLEEYDDIKVFLFLNACALDSFQPSERRKLILIDLEAPHPPQLKCYIKLYNIDVWFCPLFHLIPDDCPIPNVTAIFDIQQDFFPENFDKVVLENRVRMTKTTVGSTDLILTISEFSKQTLIDRYQISADKIKVTYLDADASFDEPLDPLKLEKIKGELPFPYILYPATMWPHKNHISLIRGFILEKKKYNLPLKLVFTGAKDRESTEIEKVIDENNLREDIRYLGYRPQEDMKYIFKCASMVAFPSLFEGFGIPLVEAMAVGTPIICSKSSCIPEIAGNAAAEFEAKSPQEISEAIYNVFTDCQLRDILVQNGFKRRTLFSWDKCARDTVEYLKSVYKPRPVIEPKLSSHPLVTVVTPSYNQGEFIRATIDSVLNQSYDNIEYIVMDGGSTDNTVEILKGYGNRIKWKSEKDKGQADAINKGIREAKGEIIGWLNSDDTYNPDAVKTAVEVLLDHPETDMVYGEGDYIDRDGRKTGRYNTKMYDYQNLAKECFICQPTAFFTKEIVEKVGMLNPALQLCMDYELWMKIGRAGDIMYIPEKMANSRMYEDNKTLSRRAEVYKECCKEVKRYYRHVPHSWIWGYAHYKKTVHPRGNMKLYYAMLFIRYNFNSPSYTATCVKKYLKMKQNARYQEKNENSPLLAAPSGRYSDGWMAKSYTLAIQYVGNETELVLYGRNPHMYRDKMVLTITLDDKKKQDFELENASTMGCIMELPNLRGAGIMNVKIDASETYVPKEVEKSKDTRELSVIIDNVFLR